MWYHNHFTKESASKTILKIGYDFTEISPYYEDFTSARRVLLSMLDFHREAIQLLMFLLCCNLVHTRP